MEHVITAPHGGIVRGVTMAPGDVVREGYPIVFIQEAEVAGGAVAAVAGAGPDHIRDDLRESYDRHAFGAGREPAGGGRPAPEAGLPHAAREHRPPRRSRLLQGILAARRRAAAPAQHHRGAAQEHAGRRRRRGHVLHQRRAVRRDALPRRRRPLRLHRAGGHAGAPQSLQAGPDLRAGAAIQAADRPVRRGRRRPAGRGRHRPPRRGRYAHLHDLLAAERAGAAGRDRQRPHVRRQHRAGRVQRRDHRDRGLDARHGRAGDDRGRRPRHLHARGGRADVRPGAERRRRHPGQGRGRGRRRREEIPLLLPGGGVRLGGARPAAPAARRAGEPAAAVRHAGDHRTPSPTRAPCWSFARSSASASSPPSSASRDGRWASSPTIRITWPARSTRTAPTRARASCSSATPSTSPC